jgi:hypothetical protein
MLQTIATEEREPGRHPLPGVQTVPPHPATPEPAEGGQDGLSVLIRRARAEFNEMPGLQLTVAQAARLWALDVATSATLLRRLVADGFLMQRSERYSHAAGA